MLNGMNHALRLFRCNVLLQHVERCYALRDVNEISLVLIYGMWVSLTSNESTCLSPYGMYIIHSFIHLFLFHTRVFV